MTDPAPPSAAPAAPAPVPGWARHEAPTPAAPPPVYMTKAEVAAVTDPAVLNRALAENRIHWHFKSDALEHQAKLLTAQSQPAPAIANPTEITHRTQLPDSSALPATEPEAHRMAELEREAFTALPGLASDYHLPGDGVIDAEGQETNDAIRSSLFAAQVPVGVAHTVIQAAEGVAQQLRGMSEEDARTFTATRTEVVRTELTRKWGADTASRITAVKTYLRGLADKAATAGQPALREILTNSPEMLDDVGAIEALWNAARHSNR